MTKKFLCQMNHGDLLDLFRSSHRRCSVKKGVLKKFGNFLKSLKTLLKRDSNTGVKFAKFLRTSILKNICERLLLYVSPQNTIANSSGTSVCTRRDLDRVQSKYFFKNITILFDQMQAYRLYIS